MVLGASRGLSTSTCSSAINSSRSAYIPSVLSSVKLLLQHIPGSLEKAKSDRTTNPVKSNGEVKSNGDVKSNGEVSQIARRIQSKIELRSQIERRNRNRTAKSVRSNGETKSNGESQSNRTANSNRMANSVKSNGKTRRKPKRELKPSARTSISGTLDSCRQQSAAIGSNRHLRLYSPAGLRQPPSGGLNRLTSLSICVRRDTIFTVSSVGCILALKPAPSSVMIRSASVLCLGDRT